MAEVLPNMEQLLSKYRQGTCALDCWWRHIEGEGNLNLIHFTTGLARTLLYIAYGKVEKDSRFTSNMCDKQQQKSEPDRINVVFLCDEWKSSRGGISTFNREFAIHLAKFWSFIVNVYCYVFGSSDQDREDARNNNVNLITAKRVPGSTDPMDSLKIPPPGVDVDVVVGNGRKFGVAAYFIAHFTSCKWMQIIHVNCEDLGKHKEEAEGVTDTIDDNENKHNNELDLCKEAHKVICVGRMLREKYKSFLPDISVEMITPGTFENFSPSKHCSSRLLSDDESSKEKEFKVFILGRLKMEDLYVKGLDIIANAVALLERRFQLICVGSPAGEQKGFRSWFLKNTKITDEQLTIRRYCDQTKLKEMFQEADLVALPSRAEGFGLIALEAISARKPVLISSQAGISVALGEVKGGSDVTVASTEPQEWANKITELSSQTSQERHGKALHLRENYREVYGWKKETEKFITLVKNLSCGGNADTSN